MLFTAIALKIMVAWSVFGALLLLLNTRMFLSVIKNPLNKLKRECSDIYEIEYVPRLLGNSLHVDRENPTDVGQLEVQNHDQYIKKISWGYVKITLARKGRKLP